MIDYREFADLELKNLISFQQEFKEQYKIDSFTNWFYDSDLEILRLYNDAGDEIYFKYIPIGTFSLNTKTWMWSWFNNHLNEKSKTETLKIKNFGFENEYKKLSEETFQSDEYDGWEFLAISFKLLNGIGVYNLQTENLNYYLLLTEKIEPQNHPEIKLLKQRTLDCDNHGFQRPAFVCKHLNIKTALGFEEAFETYPGMELDNDEDLQAWCNECEKIRQKYGEWNAESEKFAQIKLICENCYFEIKRLNQN